MHLKSRQRTLYPIYMYVQDIVSKFSEQISTENAENCRLRQLNCRLRPPA